MTQKLCCRCQFSKPTCDFGKHKGTLDGLQKYCRSCRKIADHKSYTIHKTKKISLVMQRRREICNWFKQYKSTLSCSCCPESDPAALDFHHLSKKFKNVATLVSQGYSIKSIRKEISLCTVLCANCHRKKHRESNGSVDYPRSIVVI